MGVGFLKITVKWILVLTLLTVFLVSCSKDESQISAYDGKSLNIGVVGKKFPEIVEKNINFSSISLDELLKNEKKLKSFNAIFIMEEELSKAANKKYTKLYLESGVPFFFIKSEASYLPFIDNSLTYNEYAKRVSDTETCITGILGNGNNKDFKSWKFPYDVKDGKPNKDNIKGIYSNVFKTIEKTL